MSWMFMMKKRTFCILSSMQFFYCETLCVLDGSVKGNFDSRFVTDSLQIKSVSFRCEKKSTTRLAALPSAHGLDFSLHDGHDFDVRFLGEMEDGKHFVGKNIHPHGWIQ